MGAGASSAHENAAILLNVNAPESQKLRVYEAAAAAATPKTRAQLPDYKQLDGLLNDFESFTLDGQAGLEAPTCRTCGVPATEKDQPPLVFRKCAYCSLDCLFEVPDNESGDPLYKTRPGFCRHLDALHNALNKLGPRSSLDVW